jgi:hypothetical protein
MFRRKFAENDADGVTLYFEVNEQERRGVSLSELTYTAIGSGHPNRHEDNRSVLDLVTGKRRLFRPV